MRSFLSRQAFYVLASMVVLHIGLLCLWYLSSPTGPIPAVSDLSLFARRYGMFPEVALYGFCIGLFVERAYLAWTIVLMVVLAVVGAFVHWIAGQLGIAVDWGTPQYALFGAVINFVIFAPVSLVAAIAGRNLFRSVERNES